MAFLLLGGTVIISVLWKLLGFVEEAMDLFMMFFFIVNRFVHSGLFTSNLLNVRKGKTQYFS